MGIILHMVTILVLYSSVAMAIFSYEFVAEKKSEETCILRGGGGVDYKSKINYNLKMT